MSLQDANQGPSRKVRRGQKKPWTQPSDWCWDQIPILKLPVQNKKRGGRQNTTEINDSRYLCIRGDSEDFPFLLRCLRQLLATYAGFWRLDNGPIYQPVFTVMALAPASIAWHRARVQPSPFPRLLCSASSAAAPPALLCLQQIAIRMQPASTTRSQPCISNN